jgi:hypothetical protein
MLPPRFSLPSGNIYSVTKIIIGRPLIYRGRAINGHAFGDGTILACACDFRYMKADRGVFCFPEIDISIPHLPGTLAIVKKAMPYYEVEELIFICFNEPY